MFPLPALPLVPKLHRFIEPEQAKTFMLVFGIALLVQSFLPWSGPAFIMFGVSLWPMLVGIGFLVLTFVPGLADKLNPNLLWLIVASSGLVGVLWSFAGGGAFAGGVAAVTEVRNLADAAAALSNALSFPPFFWIMGIGLMGLITTCIGLMLWARNGFNQLYWILVMSGLIALALALLVPLGYGFPLVRIFTSIGDGSPHIVARLLGTIFTVAYILFLVLLVMNVFLKKENADPVQVERFASGLFIVSLGLPLVYALVGLTGFATMLHMMVTTGIFGWLAIWGLVCFFEAKERGENLFQFS